VNSPIVIKMSFHTVAPTQAYSSKAVSSPHTSTRVKAHGHNLRVAASNFPKNLSGRVALQFRHGHARLSISASATSDAKSSDDQKEKKRPGEKKGFVEEMRFVAMRLHTKEQAPKEGKKEAPKENPMTKFQPTLEGYLQFLVESKVVYDVMEEIVAKEQHPIYPNFRNTGLERAAALEKDIKWFETEKGLTTEPLEGGVGAIYADYLRKMAAEDVPGFICHFYNVYFAHSAGGRMIGKKMSGMLLDDHTLAFYEWDGDIKELLAGTKEILNKVADDWTREEKDRCLEETELSFKYSGQILRTLFSGSAAVDQPSS